MTWTFLTPRRLAALDRLAEEGGLGPDDRPAQAAPAYLDVRITGVDLKDATPAYEWLNLLEQPGGIHITDSAGLAGAKAYYPLRELNSRDDVKIGTIVRAYPSRGGEEFWFSAPSAPGIFGGGWTGCEEDVDWVKCLGSPSRIFYHTRSKTYVRGLRQGPPSDAPCPGQVSGYGSGAIGEGCCAVLTGRSLSLSWPTMNNAACGECLSTFGPSGSMALTPDPIGPCVWTDAGDYAGICTHGFRFHFAPGINPGEWLVWITYADTGQTVVVWSVTPAGWDCSAPLAGFSLVSVLDSSCTWGEIAWTVSVP